MKIRSSAIAAILVAFGLGASAAAQEVVVQTQGASVPEIHARIVDAAQVSCRLQYNPGQHTRSDLRRCVREAVDAAVAESHRPALASYHDRVRTSDEAPRPRAVAGYRH